MRKSLVLAALAAVLATAPATAADYKLGDLTISHPWSRQTAKTAMTGAGYLEVANAGAQADRLVAVACDCAELVQVHEMKMTGGVMNMQEVAGGLEIPPGETVTLGPGGYHVMFMRLKQPFRVGETVRATLTFERAGAVEVEFDIQPLRGKKAAGGHKRN